MVLAGPSFPFEPAMASAQQPVRVVEAVNASTGDRQRYVVRDLEEGEIRAVQAALRSEGYIGIGWTGRLDDGTVAGLTRFQRERGLVDCGCVSYETIVALGLRPAVIATVTADGGAPGTSGDGTAAGASISSGVLYPVGIPILVPRPPPCRPDTCDGGEEGDSGSGGAPEDGADPQPDGSWIIIGVPQTGSGAAGTGSLATPPGVRPAPPADVRAPPGGSSY